MSSCFFFAFSFKKAKVNFQCVYRISKMSCSFGQHSCPVQSTVSLSMSGIIARVTSASGIPDTERSNTFNLLLNSLSSFYLLQAHYRLLRSCVSVFDNLILSYVREKKDNQHKPFDLERSKTLNFDSKCIRHIQLGRKQILYLRGA